MVRNVVVLPAPFRPNKHGDASARRAEVDAVQNPITADIGENALDPQQRFARVGHCGDPRRNSPAPCTPR